MLVALIILYLISFGYMAYYTTSLEWRVSKLEMPKFFSDLEDDKTINEYLQEAIDKDRRKRRSKK